jgi:hypothetical protein
VSHFVSHRHATRPGRAGGRRGAGPGALARPRAPAGDVPLTFHTDPSVASHLVGRRARLRAVRAAGRRLRVVLLVCMSGD